jgi:hypothetical protein
LVGSEPSLPSPGRMGPQERHEDEYDRARARYSPTNLLIHALGGLGHLERDEGNYERARGLYQESLVMRRRAGHQIALAMSLEDFAVLAGREQQFERAIRLLGAGERFCESLGARPPVAVAAEYERAVVTGRAALGEAAFAAAWAAGRALSLEQAVQYALEGVSSG